MPVRLSRRASAPNISTPVKAHTKASERKSRTPAEKPRGTAFSKTATSQGVQKLHAAKDSVARGRTLPRPPLRRRKSAPRILSPSKTETLRGVD